MNYDPLNINSIENCNVTISHVQFCQISHNYISEVYFSCVRQFQKINAINNDKTSFAP